jgi:septal ring factor EnvC (AmiA/AmiB activator)
MGRDYHSVSSTQRRHLWADRILAAGSLTMRPCEACLRARHPCTTSPQSDRCEQCIRFSRRCDLAPPWDEADALLRKVDKLDEEIVAAHKQIVEAEAKVLRLRQQKRLVQKRLRALGDREAKNIEELEAEEASAAAQTGSEVQPGSPSGESHTGFSQFSWGDLDRMSPVPFGSG